MATNQDQIPILQQMLRSAHQVVMGSIDAITEPEIRQVPTPEDGLQPWEDPDLWDDDDDLNSNGPY